MGSYADNEAASSSVEETINALSDLLKNRPELKSVAAKKIAELTKEIVSEGSEELEGGVAISTSDSLYKLKQGFHGFKQYFKRETTLFKALAESQHPKYMIIACADSRVDPALTLGLNLGDAFILRNVANLIHPKESNNISVACAVEYAVLHLKVEHLMVVGHSRCGGMKALLGMKEDKSNRFSDHIEDWIVVAQRAAHSANAKCQDESTPFEQKWECCAKDSVNVSLSNALTYPFVKDAVQAGTLELHGAYFDFVNGAFERWSYHETLTPGPIESF